MNSAPPTNSLLPSKELLEAHHIFPGLFTFKIILDAQPDIENTLKHLVAPCLSAPSRVRTTLRTSANGRYESVSLEIFVASADEVLAVYQKLHGAPGLRMLL